MRLRRALVTLLTTTATAVATIGLVPGTAVAEDVTSETQYAPLDRPGPRLRVAREDLRDALRCHGNPASGPGVLLSPGTTATPEQNFSWNFEKAFADQGRYYCEMWMPFHTTGDIQTAAEYIVNAIRTVHRRTGRRVDILGHSQGGMSMRWALRWWPDTRRMVGDVIGIAGTNHGSAAFGQQCLAGVTTCPPAMWQQRAGSNFITALNSRAETFRNVNYTEIWTQTDEVVIPTGAAATATSAVRTGAGGITNVATQDVCPLNLSEHVTVGTSDNVAYALAMDALDHRGPAVPSRLDPSVCNSLYMPYVDPADLTLWMTVLEMLPGLGSAELPFVTPFGAPMRNHEPRLRCYVFTPTSRPERCR